MNPNPQTDSFSLGAHFDPTKKQGERQEVELKRQE